ncbi:hypothetical protein LTR62_006451 [Meristemomyces frigidus]|uniref:Uncharacterized protein n=1 Tax=Meristemomyces frigidus TaxID=1508187 RepID=A0AAN7TCF3_9PEZI|nr:hypothetical protein LTR62_006451 [Meristemomyces frigidus]
MAPTVRAAGVLRDQYLDIPGLSESSLELDKRSTEAISHIFARDTSPNVLAKGLLVSRDGSSGYVPGQGAKPATSINNQFFFILFAILGVVMVLGALWFFFWAKNGGFKFQQGDWDDYKSTVLRRKGPDGKTLSNATKSTKLGYGASTIAGTQHYAWQKQAARSVVGRDEKGRKGIRAKRGWAKTHSVMYSDDYMTETFGTQTVSDMSEVRTEADYTDHSKRYRDRDVQQYKKEKPARVGGLNRIADGSNFASTLAGSETMSESSEQALLPNEAREQRIKEKEKKRAERMAREEASRMERRWRREAEEAAASLARENATTHPPPPPTHSVRKAAVPSAPKPAAHKQRHRSESRSASPKKRDFSYGAGPESEVLSTAYTGTYTESSGGRSASYYNEYRPHASENPRYEESRAAPTVGAGRTRQSSPVKKAPVGRKGRKGREGYRRGADSDLD